MKQIPRKAAVLGAGVMGAKIAAHIANAGIEVFLLDIVPDGSEDRNTVARSAIEHLKQTPFSPAFTHPENAKRVIIGNIEDDLHLLGDVDWIVEAIIENLEIKQSLYKRIEEVRPPDCVLSSNTSTIPLKKLIQGMPESFRKNFLITHFFNPPRYMRLMEIIRGPDTRPEIADSFSEFIDRNLGKSIVECEDTPGFICNRIGVFWLQCALLEAIRLNLSIEDVDAALSKPLGNPKTGIFGLLDLIGLDLMPHIIDTLKCGLPSDDPFQAYSQVPAVYQNLLERGHLGRKAGAGFYRIRRVDGEKISESLDLASGEYRPSRKSEIKPPEEPGKSSLRNLLDMPNDIGRFAWKIVSETLNYSAGLVPEIARNLADIDRAMRLGFNWKAGPFQMIDDIGIEYFNNRLRQEGKTLNGFLNIEGPMYRSEHGILEYKNPTGGFSPLPRLPGVLSLSEIKRTSAPLLDNACASLWDIGEKVACFEFHTPMNALNLEVLDLLQRSLEIASEKFRALVIYNDGPHFSVGANLKSLLDRIEVEDWQGIEAFIRTGQEVYQALKYSPSPVVGAPSGLALGGGAEILLHCSAIQAHIELQMGLVETGVGLIPGWGGCKEMLIRNQSRSTQAPSESSTKTFALIANRSVTQSAEIARDFSFLKPGDAITMNRDRLLADAKSKALDLARDYQAPDKQHLEIEVPPRNPWLGSAIDEIAKSKTISDYERNILKRLGTVLSAGPGEETRIDEEMLLDREVENFMALVRQPESKERIQFMLKTGKPLAN